MHACMYVSNCVCMLVFKMHANTCEQLSYHVISMVLSHKYIILPCYQYDTEPQVYYLTLLSV